MTGNEFELCALGFLLVTIIAFVVFKILKLNRPYNFYLLLPGFITCNLISWAVSEIPSPVLVTDQPIYYGFPISYMRLHAWAGYQFLPIQFFLLMTGLFVSSLLIGRRLESNADLGVVN